MPYYAPIFRYLDTDGDGGGTKNANGDYSSAAEDFKIIPPSDEHWYLARMIVSIVDTGSHDSGKYGNNITLSNGITVALKNSSDVTINDITDGVPIMKNSDWGRLAGVDVNPMSWGSGDDQTIVRFTFEKSGEPLELKDGNYLAVTLNDDLSGLVEHYFMVHGRHA